MSLTQCPICHSQCFSDSVLCPSCGETFQVGMLQARAAAEETALTRKANTVFLSLFLTSLAVLVFVELQAYVNGVGFFRP
jgi:uncharacterized membrane protein YvbJ